MHKLAKKNQRRFRRDGIYVSPKISVVRTIVHGHEILFSVENPNDVIQSEHLAGRFYEPEELAIIARHFPVGGRFCDIGANIGNHSLYVAKFLHAESIVLFEPNPAAIALLECNLFLNGIQDLCDRRYLGVGLSDSPQDGVAMRTPKRNLGGARVIEGGGEISLITGDEALDGQVFDLVKIDVEGMELAVLAGMSGVIDKTRPKIFIEVDLVNHEDFLTWCKRCRYEIAEQFQRYPQNINYLVVPLL